MRPYLILCIFFLSGFELYAQQVLFTSQIAPKNADLNNTHSILSADFDGNGTVELLYKQWGEPLLIRRQDPQDPDHYFDPEPISHPGFTINEFYAVVDMNNDGLLDIVLQKTNPFELGWMEYDGTAFIDFHAIPPAVPSFIDLYVAHADIDLDGDLDISTQNGWFENTNGMATLWTHHEYVGFTSNHILVDLNGDNALDLLTGPINDAINIQYNDGTGSFNSPVELFNNPSLTETIGRISGDFDGDSDIDILLSQGDDDFLFRNDGLGNFTSETTVNFDLSNDYTEGVSVDFDIDGDLDVLIYRPTASGVNFYFYENDGNGLFPSLPLTISENYFFHFEFSGFPTDMDQDGDLDLLMTGSITNNQEVMWLENQMPLGNPAPYFPLHIIDLQPEDAETCFFDVDEDGFIDILVANHFDQYESRAQLMWFRNEDGKGTFHQPKVISYGIRNYGQLFKSDFDGDGTTDLLLFEAVYDKLHWLRKIPGTASFEDKIDLGSAEHPNLTVSGDFDGDNSADIITMKSNNNLTLLSNLEANGNYSTSTVATITETLASITATDMNGDQNLDIIVSVLNGTTYWYPNDGTGNFGSPILFENTPEGNLRIQTADIDTDGDMDLVISGYDPISSNSNIYWLENTASGMESNIHIVSLDISLFGQNVKLIDFDNDGHVDIFPYTYGDDLIFFKNTGLGVFIETEIGTADDVNPTNSDIQDFNGDNLPDILNSSNFKGIQVFTNLLGLPTINGKCFFDENENGILNAGEIGLPFFQLSATPGSLFSYSTGDGEFSFYHNGGSYVLNPIVEDNWQLTTTPDSFEINVNVNSSDSIYLFGFSPINEVLNTDTYISSEPTRCGFDVNFFITYLNSGTLINDGFVSFTLDSLVEFNFSNPAPDSIDGVNLYWNYENFYPAQSDQIVVNATMPGVEYIGETLYFLAISNVVNDLGQIILSDPIRYLPVVNCAYDPNDKLVYPDPPGDENFTFPNDTLIYTIRFQNTGTDTAFTVRIVDQLDDDLDWNTCNPVAGSHPFQLFRSTTGELEFLFEDILLPDSNINEAASHGFAQYTIQLKENLADFTLIENTANIYFDFNPPIVTNTTLNTIVSFLPQLSISNDSLSCSGDSSGLITVVPIGFEPFQYLWNTGDTTATISQLVAGTYIVTVTDGQGNINNISTEIVEPSLLMLTTSSTASTENFNNGTSSVAVSGANPPYTYLWNSIPPQTTAEATNLPPGTYSVAVTDANGCTSVAEATVDVILAIKELPSNILSIHPNPSDGKIKIRLELKDPIDMLIEMRDINGQLVFREHRHSDSSFTIEKNDLAVGLYWVGVLIEGKWFGEQVLVH